MSIGRPSLVVVSVLVAGLAAALAGRRAGAVAIGMGVAFSLLFSLDPSAAVAARFGASAIGGVAAGAAVYSVWNRTTRRRVGTAAVAGLAVMGPVLLVDRDVSVRREVVGPSPLGVEAAEAYLRGEVRDARLPGLVLGVAYRGRPVGLTSFGSADTAGTPTSADTPFLIGSMTKSFTALAVVQLAEQGRLDLDRPASDYLQWLTFPGTDRDPTVRSLLHHAGGVPSSAGWQLFAGADDPDAAMRRHLLRTRLLPPGEIQYSNANYILLGQIIEAVTGTSYADHLDHEVIEPLGLEHTTARADVRDRARGYRIWFGAPVASNVEAPEFATPAGFVTSTASDLLQYLTALTGADAPISASARRQVLDATVAAPHGPLGAPYPGQRFAMGWLRGRVAGQEVIWHSGGIADFNSVMVTEPDGEWSFVVLTNTASQVQSLMPDITYNVIAALTGDTPLRTSTGQRLSNTYLLIDVAAVWALAVFAGAAQATTRWLRPNTKRPRRRSLLGGVVVMIGTSAGTLLMAASLTGFPVDRSSPSDFWSLWRVLLVFVPDVASLLAVLTIAPALLAICWLVVAARSEPAPTVTRATEDRSSTSAMGSPSE